MGGGGGGVWFMSRSIDTSLISVALMLKSSSCWFHFKLCCCNGCW